MLFKMNGVFDYELDGLTDIEERLYII